MSKYYILQMFNKHVNDIAQKLNEIASNGFTHILISPINISNMDDVTRWWFRYQPLSYNIGSSVIGSYGEIKEFIKLCRDKNIGVLCDVVVNHMGRFQLDITQSSTYDIYGLDKAKCGCDGLLKNITQEEIKKVEERIYSQEGYKYNWAKSDFYTYGDVPDKINGYNITDWNNPDNYRTRWLEGLPDLNDFSENVKKNRRVFMDELAILGFAGLRIDAVKHMQPYAVYDLTKQFVMSATSNVFLSERNIKPFPSSDIVIVCESLSNGSDYDVTYSHYMNVLRTIPIPETNILFYDNINSYRIKDHMTNLINFDVSTSLSTPRLGRNALTYLCNRDIARNFFKQ